MSDTILLAEDGRDEDAEITPEDTRSTSSVIVAVGGAQVVWFSTPDFGNGFDVSSVAGGETVVGVGSLLLSLSTM